MTREDLKNWYEINDYIFFDLETTGFSYSKGCKIIEIAAYRMQYGKPIDKFVTLVNPNIHIPDKLTEEVHHISDDMVKWKDPIEVVMPKFLQFIGQLPLISHNIKFDYDSFIKPLMKDLYNCELNNITLCTLEASKVLAKGTKHKLDDMYTFCTGKEPRCEHRAEADVAMGVEVANAIQQFVRVNYTAIYNSLSK